MIESPFDVSHHKLEFSSKPSDALVKFGAEVLAGGGEPEDLDDKKIVVLTRAIMDTMPEAASALLKRTTDTGVAVESLLHWINNLESDQVTKLRKLRGLIDALAKSGQLKELLKQIKYAGEIGKNKIMGGYSSDVFMELTATDTDRLKLLFEAAKDDTELTRALLHIRGAIIRPGHDDTRQDVTSFFDHGLLCASAHFGNKQATALLLKAADELSMAPEMFERYSLIDTFGSAARHGDVATLKKILELVGKAEKENVSIQSGEKTLKMEEVVESYQNRFALPKEAKASAVLFTGRYLGHNKLSNLALAIESKDDETIKFVSEILANDSNLLSVIGQVLHGPLKMSSIMSKLDPDASPADDNYQVPEKFEDFLNELRRATKMQKEFWKFLVELFPSKRRYSGPTALSKNVEILSDLPAEFDQKCYSELTKLMNLLDQMSQASGKGTEWARRLTVLFNDAESAKNYLRASIKWAMDNRHNPAVWRHRTNSVYINWPEDILNNSPDYIAETDAVEVAMAFEFPSRAFNTEPWRDFLIKYPEAVNYVALAPEIENYLSGKSETFPNTIDGLRSLVLEIDMRKCGFSEDVKKQLRARLVTRDVTVDDESEIKKWRSGVSLDAAVSPVVKDCMRRLAAMKVFPSTVATRCGEELYDKPNYVVEGDEPRYSKHEYHQDPEPGSVPWRTESYQIIMLPGTSVGELAIVANVLGDVKAIPRKFSATLDMREMEGTRKTEFIKQLCVTLVRMIPEQQIKELVCQSSPLFNEDNLTTDMFVSKILSSGSIKEVFETFLSSGNLIEFFHDNAQFKLVLSKFSSKLVVAEFGQVHKFANRCLSLVEANGGKARDVAKEELESIEGNSLLEGSV